MRAEVGEHSALGQCEDLSGVLLLRVASRTTPMPTKSTPRTPQAARKEKMMPNSLPSESEIPVGTMRPPAKIRNAARMSKTIPMRTMIPHFRVCLSSTNTHLRRTLLPMINTCYRPFWRFPLCSKRPFPTSSPRRTPKWATSRRRECRRVPATARRSR